jgi:hypothetical protein
VVGAGHCETGSASQSVLSRNRVIRAMDLSDRGLTAVAFSPKPGVKSGSSASDSGKQLVPLHASKRPAISWACAVNYSPSALMLDEPSAFGTGRLAGRWTLSLRVFRRAMHL